MAAAALPDLLDDERAAQSWIDLSLGAWGKQAVRTPPTVTVSGRDLPALRELRNRLRQWLAGNHDDARELTLEASVSLDGGQLSHTPRGRGGGAVVSLVLLETLLASHTGSLARLKTCANPACGAAFYDLSRNSSRVWHDMKTCGNTMNLRASRNRRRASPEPPNPSDPDTGPADPLN
ncbi:CGNR zinc finger domain-containing protein [Motilibacter sp. E257]|uniref:CGNR zinc finger domain-containing protein n=2 Tax=Motilibacter deserti TaxID=2714956 RepID=A0ABX0GXS1_9ACTN|nr:CGNR zinc finger domain-containing protein [Motilibacter deserti]NHC15368.1 CGNR zinc finger domain-containing protein [Motilibacter deserti]